MIGVERSRPGAPHIKVQNAAATITATGDNPVVWPNSRARQLALRTLREQRRATQSRRPWSTRIDSRGKSEWKRRGDKRSDIGYKPQHPAHNSPENRIGDADET